MFVKSEIFVEPYFKFISWMTKFHQNSTPTKFFFFKINCVNATSINSNKTSLKQGRIQKH